MRELPDNGNAKRFESPFYRIKLGFIALFVFTGLGFISSYLQMDNSALWFDMVKVTVGFLFGNGIAIGYSR